ncbi:MAG TPA: XRE family transcriptional regulator [Candidatus Saccharimonadales bacterium]|nr:XRE family transcriptional regulator [Candidatus Saccharimonadales bacterium]
MLISDVLDRLRQLVRERIEKGELTGTELAMRAGFRQAHVSNFLNERRGLSIEAMDRVMEVLRLDARDLLPEERKKTPNVDALFDSIPVVMSSALLQSDFSDDEIVEFLRFKKSFLRRIRPEMASERRSWQRFVLAKADKDSGEAMRPRLLPGATLLIDRHYNSLRSYRRRDPNLYVVKCGEAYKVRYVELQGSQLTLRPENQKCALGFVQLNKGETFADYVVGRVAHISIET